MASLSTLSSYGGNLITEMISEFASGRIIVPIKRTFEIRIKFEYAAFGASSVPWQAIIKEDVASIVLFQGNRIIEIQLTIEDDIFNAMFNKANDLCGIKIELFMPNVDINELKRETI